MEATFWHERWREGRIGFHQADVNGLLKRHWQSLDLAKDSCVFVPLCGKSLDMLWLADQGYQVLGIEINESAVIDFFKESHLSPEIRRDERFIHYHAGPFTLLVGDAFDLSTADLQHCAAVYDRAALIALPPNMRAPYLEQLYSQLPTGCRGLVITLEYPEGEKQGPPFSVERSELDTHLTKHWTLQELERVDILARETSFQEEGITRLETTAYRIDRA